MLQHLFKVSLFFVATCSIANIFRATKYAEFMLLSSDTDNGGVVLQVLVSNMAEEDAQEATKSGGSKMSRLKAAHHQQQKEQHSSSRPNHHLFLDDGNQNPSSSHAADEDVDKDDVVQSIIMQHEYALKTTKLKFFLYDDPNITLKYPSPPVWPEETKLNRKAWRMCANEIMFDESLFVVLEQSPLRTFNHEEADVFIAPIPNGRIFGSLIRHKLWGAAFTSLVQHEVFQKHHGNRHLLIATGYPLFKSYVKSLTMYFDMLQNVTLVQSWDPNGVAKAIRDGYDFHEYLEPFASFQPVTRSSISVGLATKPDSSVIPVTDFKFTNFEQIPLRIVSMEKWKNAKNFIFYHTRIEGSFHNSTIYRQVAVTNVTLTNLPQSSIGWDMASKTEWMQEYLDSKFCLVIRGDSPHSKAFLRSIRVGCIPVVVADSLPIYAPILKSTLNMSDYAVMLDEKKFVEDPEGQLLTLLNFSEKEIENKIKHLAFAQKVTMLDHPESLFVPALLHEAVVTFKTSDH